MFRLPRDILAGFLIVCALAAALMHSRWLRPLDLTVLDSQSQWLRKLAAKPLSNDVVVIGIDEAAYETIPEPYALWHRHLGLLFTGLADAQPAVVGLALPLPVRSYDFIIDGIDAPLLSGLYRLRATTPLVVGRPPGIEQQLRPLPATIVAAVGQERLASLALCEDSDGRVRRINSTRCRNDAGLEPFAQAVARHFGREASPSGLIDFSLGGEIEYIPFLDVLSWIEHGRLDELNRRFAGKPVVVASLLPSESRYRLPVALSAWDRGKLSQHGALVQVQGIRSLLGRGLIERSSRELSLLLAAACALLWFGRHGWKKTLLAAAALGGLVGLSTMALWHGHYVPTGSLAAAGLLAFSGRMAYESMRHFREKEMLRLAFAGHVSPQVMRAILGGKLHPDTDGQRCQVTILFADIRGFTRRAENATPEAMIELLNRFYGEAAAAIHRRGGAIDKFIGDGLMATFGVPQPLPCPQRNALEAAQDLLVRVNLLNRHLAAEGLQPIEIGIGIHCGEVLSGYVGSRRRRDFTVIGDPVNTAARLESFTREIDYPVACSHEVAAAVGFSGGLADLGECSIKGHSPVHVWGWQPPLDARLRREGTRA